MYDNIKWYSCVAGERIKNKTVCVKEDNQIRNVRGTEDLTMENLVFVNNIAIYDFIEDKFKLKEIEYVEKGEQARITFINLQFR